MDINQLIAENLQYHRMRQNMSIGQLAERTGLSKAVLSQMEKGNANPTINTIWKIATALHVPYSAILEPQRVAAEKISRSDLTAQPDEDGHYRISCYYPSTSTRDFEWFLLELDPHTSHTTEGHTENSQEYVLVKSGELAIQVADQTFGLTEGDALYFDASVKHTYRNDGGEVAQAYCINYYPKEGFK